MSAARRHLSPATRQHGLARDARAADAHPSQSLTSPDCIATQAEERGLKLSVPPSATGPSGTPHRPASAGPLGPNARANTNPTQPSIRLPGSPASAAGTPSRQQFPAPPLPAAPTGPPPPPPQRTLLDKFADALLGMPYDPNTRYALICANCFTHNGLVPKEQWEGIRKSDSADPRLCED